MARGDARRGARRRGGAAAFAALVLALPLAGVPGAGAGAERLAPDTEIRPFAREMRDRHGLSEDTVARILADAVVQPKIIEAMDRPAESMPWHRYRRIFIEERRIADGVEFWKRHAATIERAHERYGVAPRVIVAIIGVETLYGQRTGSTRVVDSLATLAFRYPRRATFFRRELEQFLLLAANEGLDPLTTRGSYAGAMGIPQFISSSYRAYAVDFDDDGTRDLVGSPVDAIGSVARYLAEHGWRRDRPVAFRARVQGAGHEALVERGIEPSTPLAEFAGFGVGVAGAEGIEDAAALVELEGEDGPQYWAGLRNFYAITRYNRSSLYAMAVHQLAEAIAGRMGRGGDDGE